MHIVRRTLTKLFICLLAIAAVTLGAFFLALYMMNRREVRVAQKMMTDASQLQIGRSTLADVLTYASKYNGEKRGSWPDRPCRETDCLVTAWANKNDFWERHPKLGYAVQRVLRRGWHYSILIWVKDGKMTGIQQWFAYSKPRASSFVITTVSRPGSLCRNPYYRLHHGFAAYPGPKAFHEWVNPEATSEKELLRLNVACALRMSGCNGIADMVPTAWARYEADAPIVEAQESRWRSEATGNSHCPPD
jgi:hypothetical protein